MKYTVINEKMVNGEKQLVKESKEFHALPFILWEDFAEKLQREIVRTKLCDTDRKDDFKFFSAREKMFAEHFGIKIADNWDYVIDRAIDTHDVPDCLRNVFRLYHFLFAGHYYDGHTTTDDGNEKKCTYGIHLETLRHLCNEWASKYGDNADGAGWDNEQRKLFNDIKAELENMAQKHLNGTSVDGIRKGYSITFKGTEVKVFINGCLHRKVVNRIGTYKYESVSAKAETFGKYFLNFILSDKKKGKADKTADMVF